MIGKKASMIQPGDKFEKVGNFKSVWTVTRLLDIPDLPPHLHITPEDGHRVLTFSVSALLDTKLFVRVQRQGEKGKNQARVSQRPTTDGKAHRESGSFMRGLFGHHGHTPEVG